MKYYKIAGLNIALEGTEYQLVKERMKNYKVQEFEEAHISVNFEFNNFINCTLPDYFVSKNGRFYFETENKYGFYDYITEVDKVVSFMTANKGWNEFSYIHSDLNDLFGIPVERAVFNVLGHLFSQGIRMYNGAVLHASTIIYDGKAVTFTAPSGTGKSTHTALWKKYYPQTEIINDDMPAIRKVNGVFNAYGTPWAGKTDINVNTSAPLSAMVFIERATECSITKIEPIEAVIRMMREIPVSVFKSQTDILVEFYNDLFRNVPAYLLKCDISKDAVDVVKNKLFG